MIAEIDEALFLMDFGVLVGTNTL